MNILLLENEGSWRGQCLLKINERAIHKVDSFTDTQLNVSVEKLAEQIVNDFIFVDLFIINVNMIGGNQNRSSCFGIKLIKLLRLHGLKQHCILYSFMSREQLMELSPENLIVFSEGLTYIRLPFYFEHIDSVALSKKLAPKNLTAYLKAESRLPDDRHFFANWWGALQLWEVHKNVFPMDDVLKNSIQDQLCSSSKEISSYQGLLAQYLYGTESQKFSDAYIESKRELHNRYSHFTLPPQAYNQQIAELDRKIETVTIEHERYRDILNAITTCNNNWQKFLLNWSGKPKEISTKIKHFEIGINEATTEKEQIQRFLELEKYIEVQEHQYITEKENLFLEKVKAIEESKNANDKLKDDNSFGQLLHEKSPKILYIDDQAGEGWGTIFQLMVYGRINSECFQVFQPNKSSDIESVIEHCFECIQSLNPGLIILDLRLLGETGTIVNVNDLSGAKVLNALKFGYKQSSYKKYSPVSCPVMIVTASNKVNTYQFINAIGADAYWIKEGIDNKFSLVESILNYRDFLWKVSVLCYSKEFNFLKKLKLEIEGLKNTESRFWWESEQRFSSLLLQDSHLEKLNRNDIFSILNECRLLTESLLQNLVLKNISLVLETSVPSLIAIRLFRIIEMIHEEKSSSPIDDGIRKRIEQHHQNRNIARLKEVLILRNVAAHENSISISDLDNIFSCIINYIKNNPSANNFNSENVRSAPHRYKSTISKISKTSKLKDNHIKISIDTPELKKDFPDIQLLLCLETKIINDDRCIENRLVEFDVKCAAGSIYTAYNLNFL